MEREWEEEGMLSMERRNDVAANGEGDLWERSNVIGDV